MYAFMHVFIYMYAFYVSAVDCTEEKVEALVIVNLNIFM